MKTFHDSVFPSLTRVDAEGGRTYLTPTGNRYPSVTSVVGQMNQEFIKAWQEKVGKEEAAKISNRASKRGTAIHSLCENYLKEGTASPDLFDMDLFNSLRPVLDDIDNIHCLETQMFSHKLQVAGTVDCIGEYKGRLCVIDFKTAKKAKRREWIHNYFIQTSAYAVMFEEHTGIPVPDLLIIVGVDDEEPQLFHEKRDDWIPQFNTLRETYRETKGL